MCFKDNKFEMNDDKKIDEKHVGKSDKTILFLDTDVGETNKEDVEQSDKLPTPGKIDLSITIESTSFKI